MLGFLNGLVASASSGTINWGSIVTADAFDGMLNGISTVLPVVAPIGLTIAGIPIVWKLVKRFIKG